jgi:DNA-binding NtrC family response regulator
MPAASLEPSVLIVEDENLIRWSLGQAFAESGFRAEQAADAAQALEAAAREAPDVVLLDYRLPDQDGIFVLRELRKLAPDLPVIMITAHASISGAVEAIKEGAYDYISKPFEIEDVIQTVRRALEIGRLREELARQRERTEKEAGVFDMVARSPAMLQVLRLVDRVASSEASTILLLGESGVGKGLVARALHDRSAGTARPFMHITCTALTETLLESELFGHEKGSFTDAKVLKKGLFEIADGGTVFLDEIADLSPGLQGKLLRFLEDRVFRRVGGIRDIRVSVRIVAATNKNMAEEVAAGRFRNDLYFRLRVIPIEIPPLRERREDIEPLARRFLARYNAEFHKQLDGFEPRALELMRNFRWPGNVRELRNAIERAVLLSDGTALTVDDLPPEIRASEIRTKQSDSGFRIPAAGLVLEDLERDLVRQALEMAKGNRTHAARLLGMNRDQIRYRIEKFSLDVGLDEEKIDGADQR